MLITCEVKSEHSMHNQKRQHVGAFHLVCPQVAGFVCAIRNRHVWDFCVLWLLDRWCRKSRSIELMPSRHSVPCWHYRTRSIWESRVGPVLFYILYLVLIICWSSSCWTCCSSSCWISLCDDEGSNQHVGVFGSLCCAMVVGSPMMLEVLPAWLMPSKHLGCHADHSMNSICGSLFHE